MPPGPPLPRAIQTAGFMIGGMRFLEACRRRYGDAVTFGTVFDNRFVMLFDPDLVKELFQGSAERLHAGEANAMLGPIVGQRSVLLLDGAEHLRHRRLLLPPFHGPRMQGYAELMLESTDLEIDAWPVREPFPMIPSMQSLTLRVITRAVFGFQAGAEEQELRERLRAMIDPVGRPRGMMVLFMLTRRRSDRPGVRRFEESRRAVDEILFAEIARRRADSALADRDDVFSALLLAEDEHGERLSDQEVRDELMTLLLAGHETTATGLAWTFDLLLHHAGCPQASARGRRRLPRRRRQGIAADAPGDPGRRARGLGRAARAQRLGDPAGVEINPSIRIMHQRDDLYPDAAAFRPERFLGADAPDTYTWIPFGGGTRRCLGASFAQMEMRIVLRRVLERCALRASDPKLDEVQFRGITQAPRNGVLVTQDREPRAGSGR